MWKGDPSGIGLYGSESTLTPTNVNPSGFGMLGQFQADGLIMAQPLYVSNLKLADGSTHNLVIVVTEHDSVFALDVDALAQGNATPLWQRGYIDPNNGITTMSDSFGGANAFEGEVGITGTPYIDADTGALYFVTTLTRNGVPEQWLRAIDVRTGNDFGPGGVKIAASMPGDGPGSANGQIAFDPSLHNQRAGLMKAGSSILVAWGSFSDWDIWHGWLMAFDASTLQLTAAFNSTPQSQAVDSSGNSGAGGAIWQGGASPSVDAKGNIYVNAGNGGFNIDSGGKNYGNTLLKLGLNGGSFQVLDSFTPFNSDCINLTDLELGSGGLALLPNDSFVTGHLGAVYNKEGRLFIVNLDKLGGFNSSGDNQIPMEVMVGSQTCSPTDSPDVTEGPTWNRLYGNPAYWNGNLYVGVANGPLKQYQFQNGLPNPTPVAVSPSAYGYRGGNSVVSANGNQSGIVWVNEKYIGDQGILHAYDATNVANELWNSNMNSARDALGTGIGFGVPVVANGRVMVASDTVLNLFGLLQ